MQDTWVRSLGWEDPLEKEMATHSSILACRIPWTEEPGGLQSTGLQRVRHDWAISLSLSLSLSLVCRRRQWHPTPVLLGNPLQCSCLGNSMNRRARRAIVHEATKSRTLLSDFRLLAHSMLLILLSQTLLWKNGNNSGTHLRWGCRDNKMQRDGCKAFRRASSTQQFSANISCDYSGPTALFYRRQH